MILHPALVQQDVVYKKISAENDAAIGWKSRTSDGKTGTHGVHQRLRHRADVSGVRRVEGRAVFEKELVTSGTAKPMECGKRRGDGLILGCAATLERDDD